MRVADVLLGIGLGWFLAAVLNRENQGVTINRARELVDNHVDGDDPEVLEPEIVSDAPGQSSARQEQARRGAVPEPVARLLRRLIEEGISVTRRRVQEGLAYYVDDGPPVIILTGDGFVVDRDALERRLGKVAQRWAERQR